jgi:hypothetical protein
MSWTYLHSEGQNLVAEKIGFHSGSGQGSIKTTPSSRELFELLTVGYQAVIGVVKRIFRHSLAVLLLVVVRYAQPAIISGSKTICYCTYGTARKIDAAIRPILQNMSRHICVRAVFPKLEIRLFLIFVAIVG